MAYRDEFLVLTSGEDITAYRLIAINSSGQAVHNTSSTKPIGASVNNVKSSLGCEIRLKYAGTLSVEAAGTINAGAEVEAAAAGRVLEKTTGTAIGVCIQGAGASQLCEILLY